MLSEFRFRFKGKDLGIEKLNILKSVGDGIEDDDILYSIVNKDNILIDQTDWVGEAIDIIQDSNNLNREEFNDECIEEMGLPWHIQITSNGRPISKTRFNKLFGDALLLAKNEES